MNTGGLINLILDKKLRVFTTADFVMLTRMKKGAAVKALGRLSRQKLVFRLKRGIWISNLTKDISPLEALPYLTIPWPSYISLESALSEYGVVSQISIAYHAITLGKPMHLKTPIGEFRIHHFQKKYFGGYQLRRAGPISYPLAFPEKAMLDILYLRYRLGGTPNYAEWDISLLDPKRLKQLVKPFPMRIKKLVDRIGIRIR